MPRNTSGLKPFTKGKSGNPKGSSERQRALGQVSRLTGEALADIASALLYGTEGALEAMLSDPKANVLSKWTAKLIMHSMIEGDAAVYNAVLNRIVGKVKERIEHSGPGGDAIAIRSKMSVEEMEAKVEAMRAARLEIGND